VYRNHEAFEVTTYRTESTYSDGRHPDSVLPARSIEEDLQRRDFTINAMAFHPTRGLLDPYGGLNDLTNALVCSVGDPLQRFSEDALRILRGCRFSSQLGFSLEENTFQAMLYKKHLLRKISGERIYSELERFVCGPFVHDALLNCVDVLSFVLPELLAMKNCPQVTKYHIYDVLEHTAYVMQNTPAKPLQRWTALFHDMGKPAAAFFEGEVEHFYGHAYVSVEIAESVMNRLPFPTALKHDVPLLVRVHDDYIEANHRCVKRALARLGGRTDLFEALCDIKAGDALGQAPFCAARADEAEELRALMHEILENEEAFSVKHLHIKGSDLIEMGYQPGPLFKEILETVLEAVVNEEIPNEQEELCAFVRAQFPLE
jgi:tRNA nucleotidyltransferase (CCA-adding enzyme)